MSNLKLLIFGVVCVVFRDTNAQDCTANPPANGAVNGATVATTIVADSDATYTCNSGFILDGISPLMCTAGALGTEPTCKADCTPTAPTNGAVTPTTVIHGASVTFSCETGYIVQGTATATCNDGTVTASTCAPGCTATAPTNGLVDGEPTSSVTNTNTVTYSCDGGYTLSSSATLTCTSGSLVGTVPTCNGDCTPTAPANGAVTPATVIHGASVTFSCETGYIVQGTAMATCNDGTVTAATCAPGCTATAPTNGLVDGEPTSSVTNTNTVTYSCDGGYTLSSSATLTCTSGSLVGTVPTCNGDCTPTAPANGAVTPATVIHGATVTFSCETGYIVQGTAMATCNDGTVTAATCAPGCTATAPTNGLVDGEPTSSVTNTNTVTYSCDGGYTLSSSATLTCTSGSLVGTVPTCNGDCTPTAPANGAVTPATVIHGASVTFSCETGYIVQGTAMATCNDGTVTAATCAPGCTATAPTNGLVDGEPTSSVTNTNTVTYSCDGGYTLSSSATLTCTSGSLVGTVPTCNGDCTPTAPANGAVTPATVIHGASVTFSCETGYIVQGTAMATCNDGTVTAATCAPGCTATAPTNGLVDGEPTSSVTNTNTVTYSCDGGYTLSSSATLTCTSGSLVGTVPTCNGDCTPTTPANGAVTPATVIHGASVTFSCETGYIVQGTAMATCNDGTVTAATCAPGCTAPAPTNGLVDGEPTSSVTNTNTVTYSCNGGYTLSSSATLTCTSGSLVGTVPTCNGDCTPTAPANGAVTPATVIHGASVTFSCETGYIVQGTAMATCNDGTVTAATCAPGCTATAPTNGLVDGEPTSSVTNTNTVTYSCNGGYTLSSSATLTCTSGSLVGTVPTCNGDCTPTAPANGAVTPATVIHGASVTFSCETGYIVQGTAMATCNDGTVTAATCAPGCTATAPTNGLVDGEPTSSVTNTNTVTYSCNGGYTLSSSATLTCTSGSLVGTVPTCNGDCTPTAPANGAVTPATVIHGASVTFSCETGYIVQGTAMATCNDGTVTAATCAPGCTSTAPTNGLVDGEPTSSVTNTNTVTYSCNGGYTLSSSATLTCTSGSLVGTVPTCNGDCTPTAPANGAVTPATVIHGASVTFSCETGYIVQGTAMATCNDGTVTAATCAPGCTATAPTNGLVDGEPTSSVTNTNTVTYSCNGGYTLSSSATLTCTSGSLVGTVPTCNGDCTPTAPANGAVTPTTVIHGASVTFSCETGYIVQGTAMATCNDGTVTAATCAQGCTATAPTNGLVDGTATSSVTNTNTVTYSCNGGYTLSSSATLTCTSGSLVGAVPTCNGDCTPTVPANGAVTPTTVIHGASVTFSCETGYIVQGTATATCNDGTVSAATCAQGCTATAPTNGLVDNLATSSVTNTNTVTYSCNGGYTLSSSATLTCTSGSLVGTVPTCNGDCTPTAPANGAVTPTTVSHGATVTFSCETGYLVQGTATATCNDGTVTAATCAQGCAATAPTNGLVDGAATSSVTNTDTVTYSCNGGYTLSSSATLTCTSGSLVGTVPTCNGDCTPTAPTNGAVTPTTVSHGATVTFSCDTGYLVQGTATATCNDGTVTAATCAQDCTTAAPANGAVTATTAIHGASVTYSCDSGYAVIGTATPTCNDGLFTPPAAATCSSVPVFAANSPTTASIEENTVVGTTVTNVITAAGDADLTYALTSQTPDSTPKIFAVASASGLLTIATSPDYETSTSYDLVITVTSSKGTANDAADDTSAQHTITVSITDVDDSAVIEKASILMISLLLLAKYL